MTKADFYKSNGSFCGFCISGHSGYAGEGSDIVCSAISSGTMLVVNTITEFFKTKGEFAVDDKTSKIVFILRDEDNHSSLLLESFCNELKHLAELYPDNLSVLVKG